MESKGIDVKKIKEEIIKGDVEWDNNHYCFAYGYFTKLIVSDGDLLPKYQNSTTASNKLHYVLKVSNIRQTSMHMRTLVTEAISGGAREKWGEFHNELCADMMAYQSEHNGEMIEFSHDNFQCMVYGTNIGSLI